MSELHDDIKRVLKNYNKAKTVNEMVEREKNLPKDMGACTTVGCDGRLMGVVKGPRHGWGGCSKCGMRFIS